MSSWDIWQILGTPQIAEITALASFVTSVLLAQKPSSITGYKKKCLESELS